MEKAKVGQWLPQITSGEQIGEILDRMTNLEVIQHHSLTEDRDHLAEKVLDELLWWYESRDRIDHVGVAMREWNLRKLEIRFDGMLSKLEREGIWLVMLEDQEEDGLHVAYWLVPKTLHRISMDGIEEQYIVCVPTERSHLNHENWHSKDTGQEEGK